MKLLRRTLIATAAALFATGAAHAAATVGQPAPDFTLTDATGKPVRLSDFKGKHVVLEWTNPGCPFVRKHYDSGNMPATQKDATGKNVVWLSINSTEKASSDYLEPARLSAWLAERKAVPTAVLMDEEGTVGKSYGARTTPHMYIIDPKGTLAYAGAIDDKPSASASSLAGAKSYVRQAVAEMKAGKPVSEPATKAYGCAVKYAPVS